MVTGMLLRKLLRDLWALKGQALTIVMVVAAGVSALLSSMGAYDSLVRAQREFYAHSGFADVFAELKRAPKGLQDQIGALPGVEQWETRLRLSALLDIPGRAQPPVGLFLSLPDIGAARLNRIYLRAGRFPSPERADEVVVAEGFAQAHGFRPGDRLAAIFNGRKQVLQIVGIGVSPEFIYAMAGQSWIPDDQNFGVFWIREAALASAFQMEGAFNSVALTLAPGTPVADTIAALDALLKPYGTLGAYARSEQPSHLILTHEIAEQRTMAVLIPTIFLGVAAFLIYMTTARIVATQREQIATLKAMGYGNATVAAHYLLFACSIALAGSLLGVAGGAWAGVGEARLYTRYFRFPALPFQLAPAYVLVATSIGVGAAAAGALRSVGWVMRLAPAEAMRPPAPPAFSRSWIDRLTPRWLAPETRMALRHIGNAPLQSLFTSLGIACALALLILGTFWVDAIYTIVDTQFSRMQRDDAFVSFTNPLGPRAGIELNRMPGVLVAEPLRAVPVRLVSGPRSSLTVLLGLPARSALRQPLDAHLRPLPLPAEGVLLSAGLADKLQVRPGDRVIADVLEGERPSGSLPVAGLVDDMVGTSAYMEKSVLNRWMKEGAVASGAALAVDPAQAGQLYATLKESPAVAAISTRAAVVENFHQTYGGVILGFSAVLALFAGTLAVGVIYNSARIALSERAWELASLRVLGFTQGEVSRILLGKLGIETAVAL
ncbi:MAG TPA: FtsX-like permease family protein, partial [bacterium]|nr:FtsX-like permease family protein [bacterium]